MAKKKKGQTFEEKLQAALVTDWEQPYNVPDNWVWTTLGNVCKFERGITFPASAKEKVKTKDNIPCLRTANVQEYLKVDNLIYVNKSYLKENINKITKINDIIMSSANSRELVGKTAYVNELNEEMTFGGFVLTIRANKISSKLLFYMLRLEFLSGNFMKESTQTTNIANINTTTLSKYKFSLPPLAEQQRIVDRIESLFSKLDHAKELAQSALDSFETRKAAILHKAFTGDLTAKWREENSVSLDSWEINILKKLCKISSGGTPSRKNGNYYTGNIPWIKTGEICWNNITDSKEKITEDALQNSSAKVFPIGTVVVAMYGMGVTRGRAGILEVEAATNQAVCALMPNEKIINRYLFYYFMNNYEKFRALAVGGNQLNLSGKIISNFEINFPSLPEQSEIISILDSVFEKEKQAKEFANVIDKIDLMKKAILARAFRGELGTNDPEEESAMELLKEILKEG